MTAMGVLAWLLAGCADPCEATWYADLDGDGYGDPAAVTKACTAPMATVSNALDCDDSDANIHPEALDPCNGVDEDCDGELDEDADYDTLYLDADRDGFGDPGSQWTGCDGASPPLFTAPAPNDCDDLDPQVHPGATEQCNGEDDDCDGDIDEDAEGRRTFWVDYDGDGYGYGLDAIELCPDQQFDLADTSGDCNDSDPLAYPGAPERCNGFDDDCDSLIDEDAVDATTWYVDGDFDGWGTEAVTLCNHDLPDVDTGLYGGFALSSFPGDCDDTRSWVHPGADELCNGFDDDCDTFVDSNDSNVVGETRWYFDQDLDGFGTYDVFVQDCYQPGVTWSPLGGDCDPADGEIHPDADERCNGFDDDCDDLVDAFDPELLTCP